MDNRITIGKVHVVEWLRPEDQKTGWQLLDEIEPLGVISQPPVEFALHQIAGRAEFLSLLRRIEDEFRSTRRTPILHIETHGDQRGIGCSDEDGVVWRELMEELIPLNRLTGLNLVVLLAACEGFYGVQMMDMDRRAAAFRGLIGPHREVSSDELLRGCVAFYRSIVEQRDGNLALKAMNQACDPDADTFWMISAEEVFQIVNRSHFEEHCTPEALARRRDRLLARLTRRYQHLQGQEPSPQLADEWFKAITAHLLDQRGLFEQLRRQFFFVNEFPENDERFDVKFEDCWPAGMELRVG